MDTPLVTILTPSYNRAAYIATAIESVLAQTFTDWELIVIDDASTDGTEAIVKNCIEKEKAARNGVSRISYIRQPKNVGIAHNRNTGLEKARGTYIAVLDSDDVWTDPEKLAKQVDFFKKNAAATANAGNPARPYGIVGSWVKKIDTAGKEIGEIRFCTDDAAIRTNILLRHQFAHSSVVFLKQAALDIGGYSPAYTIGDDYDLMLAIGRKYAFANLPEYTTAYRIHDDNITKTKRALHAREHFAIIKKYRRDYPGFWAAAIKSYVRIVVAYV
jgi:glycosyltransferase involved in cell wall biosynthesis